MPLLVARSRRGAALDVGRARRQRRLRSDLRPAGRVVPPAFVDGRSFADRLHGGPPPSVRAGVPHRALARGGRHPAVAAAAARAAGRRPDRRSGVAHHRRHRAAGRPAAGRPRRAPAPSRATRASRTPEHPEYHGVRTDHLHLRRVRRRRPRALRPAHDPYELTNVYDRATRATRIALAQELAAVTDCGGRQCRVGDARPSVPLRFRRARARSGEHDAVNVPVRPEPAVDPRRIVTRLGIAAVLCAFLLVGSPRSSSGPARANGSTTRPAPGRVVAAPADRGALGPAAAHDLGGIARLLRRWRSWRSPPRAADGTSRSAPARSSSARTSRPRCSRRWSTARIS